MAEFYVAPDGNDKGAGNERQPFATLDRARRAVRELLDGGARRDVHVAIRGGVYQVRQTIVFGLEDSAPEGCTITYQAYPGEQPIFSAGVPITGWRKVCVPIEDLPQAAAGKIWAASLPDGPGSFKTLYQGQGQLPRARTEGFSPTRDGKSTRSEDTRTIAFPAGAMRDWENLQDIEVVMVTGWPWTMNLLPLESVDEPQLIARTAVRGTYDLIRPRWGKFEKSAYVENTLDGLRKPGHWVVDRPKRLIYHWPIGEEPGNDIVAPALTELIRIEGDIEYDGPTDQPVRGVVLRGLSFTHGDRYAWQPDQRGWGLQHDWELFDRPTAMVRLRGAEQCVVEHCHFTNAGSTGIRLDLHCQHNTIDRNTFAHIGGVGVLLAGYGLGTKDVNQHNHITANHIHHIGEKFWHSPAIFAWQSGENRIAHNLTHHTPYSGIVVSGRIIWDRSGNGECARTIRWAEIDRELGAAFEKTPDWEMREPFMHSRRNVVERNEIHHAIERLTDGNGIYVSGAGRGNIVRENFVHDCPHENFAEGIRCDDDQYDAVVERNVLWRLGGMATYVTIKGRNHVTNNIFAEPLTSPVRGMLSLEFVPGQFIAGSDIRRNIFYTTAAGTKFCFQGHCYYDTTTWLRDANADRNLYFSTADPHWGRAHIEAEQGYGSEMNSVVADPMFVDAENGDFGLREGSPALALGFEPIDMSRIGPDGVSSKQPSR